MIATSPNTRGIARDATRVSGGSSQYVGEIERLLHAVVKEFPAIGYTQGMNDVLTY